MAAEVPVVSFDVALPSVGKLEVPLDKRIPLIAVRGSCEQHLETVPGFRGRDVFASKLSGMGTHVNAVAQRMLLRPDPLKIDRGIEDDTLRLRVALNSEHIRFAFSLH
jgi:hypothetical protein